MRSWLSVLFTDAKSKKRNDIPIALSLYSLSNKMDNSLLAVRDINHKYIVVEKERRRYEAEKKTSQNISAKGLSSGPEKNTESRVDQTVDQPAGKSVTYQSSATPAWSLASARYAWLDDANEILDLPDYTGF